MAAKIAMMAMTTKSSMRVKPNLHNDELLFMLFAFSHLKMVAWVNLKLLARIISNFFRDLSAVV